MSDLCLNFFIKCSTKTKLFKNLKQRYNKTQLKLLDDLKKSRRKIHNLNLRIKFLHNCLENKVCPKVLFYRIEKAKLKCSPVMEKTFIKDEIRRCSSTVSSILINYSNALSLVLDQINVLDSIRFLRYLKNLDKFNLDKINKKHDKNLKFLIKRRFGNLTAKTKVHNLSSYVPSEDENFVLKHGLKFCVPPNKCKREHIFSEFEVLSGQLQHHKPLSKIKLEQCMSKLNDLSYTFSTLEVNYSDKLMRNKYNAALKQLKENPNIVLCKADKENIIVILNKTDYIEKMMVILNDKSKFLKLGEVDKFDHTSKIENSVQRKLRCWFSKGLISKETYELTRPIGSQRPKLYGLPKTHKNDIPLRPILSMTKSPQSNLSTFLVSVLQPVLDKFSKHTVPDSFTFVNKLKSLKLSQPNSCMVSFDIKSLFTNVPLDEVLSICLDQLYNSELLPPPFCRAVCKDMLCIATKNVQFSFNNFMYRQIDGVAMGSPLGPILANIFVGFFENSLLCNSQIKPLAYYRYVDDVFAVFLSKSNVDSFHTALNAMHKCISFTVEEETSRKLNFLDICILRNSDNSFSTSVYRKDNFSPHYIRWNSFCPKKTKIKDHPVYYKQSN